MNNSIISQTDRQRNLLYVDRLTPGFMFVICDFFTFLSIQCGLCIRLDIRKQKKNRIHIPFFNIPQPYCERLKNNT